MKIIAVFLVFFITIPSYINAAQLKTTTQLIESKQKTQITSMNTKKNPQNGGININNMNGDDYEIAIQNSQQLCDKEQIDRALDKMAKQMSKDLRDENPLVIGVMTGAIVTMGQLLPKLDFPLEVDYLHATRYLNETTGSTIKWIVEPRCSLKGRTVVLVDDVLDKGVTLAEIIRYCENQGAKKIVTAVLIDKNTDRSESGIEKADYSALSIPDEFVVGFGMDYKGYFRNADGIYVVADGLFS